ncbi:30S ribosomal protein S16 [Buchnera aphidicola (Mollitrichosiphum nigrofasciatum)]|uniref:30S ribosomal protein S16 n=1 Tax=Buchnera aphidicola TaxID=9 RepID=UPI0031B81627
MVVIRLARHGSKKKPFYKIVVSDKRFARDGRFIENIGYFDPIQSNNAKKTKINITRYSHWIKNGAIASNRIKKIITIHNKNSEKNN